MYNSCINLSMICTLSLFPLVECHSKDPPENNKLMPQHLAPVESHIVNSNNFDTSNLLHVGPVQ